MPSNWKIRASAILLLLMVMYSYNIWCSAALAWC